MKLSFATLLTLGLHAGAIHAQVIVGHPSAPALSAAQVAYAEGEISLVEWLDAVRAYHEAEATFASLRAESLIRRAALERVVGMSLLGEAR